MPDPRTLIPAILATLALTVIGGTAIRLPLLTAAESWALEATALVGLLGWSVAALFAVPAAANDDGPAGYGGRPFAIAD